jgi:alpha-galactosidase
MFPFDILLSTCNYESVRRYCVNIPTVALSVSRKHWYCDTNSYNMKTLSRSMHVLAILLVFTKGWCGYSGTHHGPSNILLDKLKHSAVNVILSDVSKADAAAVSVRRNWKGDLCELSVKNISKKPVSIREVIVFDMQHGLNGSTPIYGEAFQMLNQLGGSLENPKDLGTYSDKKHYRIPEPDSMRTAYGMLTLQLKPDDRVLLATTSCNKFISRFSFDAKRLRISIDCERLILHPGEQWNLEEFIAIAGEDRERLYDRLSEAIAKHHPKLDHDAVPVGWCSWYCFGPGVTAKNVADNTTWIANNLPALKYIQIDDGYQPWMGDWLDAGKAFGGDIQSVLKEVKSKNLEPAIWVAPFIASPQSTLFKEHPDWMVKDANGDPLRSDKIGFGGWRQGPWYVLDGTHPAVQKYLEELFRTLREKWGCTYFKLDANYWGAIHGGVHYDTNATRIEAYRRGMEAIRRGAGNAFLLGCNHPIWGSLGLIHGSRSSLDISRKWETFRDIGKENLFRGWQNGRLWWNDPDCILLNVKKPAGVMNQGGKAEKGNGVELTDAEFIFHATAVYASGGMLLSGDDLTNVPAERIAILKKLIPPTGIAARFENENFETGVTILKDKLVFSVFNWDEDPVERVIKLPSGKYRLVDKWTSQPIGTYTGEYHIRSLDPHTALLIEAIKIDEKAKGQ